MYSTAMRRISLPALGVCLGFLVAGCNLDLLWPDRQAAPAGAEAFPVGTRGGEESTGPIDIVVADAREVDLVEAVVMHRAAYRRTLEQLRVYYEKHGYAHKETWAAFELKGLRRVKAFRYFLDAEIPSASLRGEASIKEADALYEEGLELMRKGGHGVPALYREEVMIEAAQTFRDMIEQYPASDKIDDAAFMCGEIHENYLPGQEALAVKWYERAWTWDPNTPHPARFQAALVYDYRLHDRDRALELYKSVLKHETTNNGNVLWATRRIHELTTDGHTARANGGRR